MSKFILICFILSSFIQYVTSININNIVLPQPNQFTSKFFSDLPESDVKVSIEKDITRYFIGIKGFFTNFKISEEIKKQISKRNPSRRIETYSEFRFLDTFNEDSSKLLRMLITIPISIELFVYSNLIIPIFSLNKNVWAWKQFPSTFRYQYETENAIKIYEKRRLQAVINGLSILVNGCVDDIDDVKRRDQTIEQLQLIENALQQKSLSKSLEVLKPWYTLSKEEINKLQTNRKIKHNLSLSKNFSWLIVRDICKSLGSDPLPNIYFIRRFNRGEVNKYLDKVINYDQFLGSSVDLSTLSNDEVSLF